MSKALKIILVLVLIIVLIIIGAWYLSRKKAVEDAQTAPTFRQFLGLGTRTTPAITPGGGLSPDSPGNDASSGNDTGNNPPEDTDGTPPGDDIEMSNFTSGPLTPTQGIFDSQDPQFGGGGSGQIPTSSGPQPSSVDAGTASGAVSAQPTPANIPLCSDEDLNIAFTSAEINRLNALQKRFYELASNLNTDRDVITQVENYNLFKSKADLAMELYNYCASKAPLITSSEFTTRVSTPFWRDPSKDKGGYIPKSGSNTLSLSAIFKIDPIDPRDGAKTQEVLEKVFKVNLW